jgi:hypothetical protein
MGTTPEQRARILDGLYTQTIRDQQRAQDRAHLPGGGADAITRAGFWEERTDVAAQHWERLNEAWKAAAYTAGPYPDVPTQARIARMQADADLAGDEYRRCRQLRDEAIREAETHWSVR